MTPKPPAKITRLRPLSFGLLVGLFSSMACDGGGVPATSDSAPAQAAEPVAPATPVVEIDMDEYVILMDATAPSGPVTLQLANRGFEEHNLLLVIVESDSTVWETESRLSPGERRDVAIDLSPGLYKAVCDFSGHEGRGMFIEFRVEAESADGTS